ncbi:MAG: hypothetical protein KA788_05950 [Lacunisphaera sp.]|nr:hypothetical protein [Lacunisphaera sp.]
MMAVFDDIEPDLDGPMAPDETDFGYVSRSNRPEAARVRDLIEDWISRYPDEHRPALVARLRSKIDDAHQSAFFELALHELLLVTGHVIVAIEPKLEHTPYSPDFLVQTPDGSRFYLEAVVATAKSAQAVSADKRLNMAIAAIERVESPAHFLDLHIEGKPSEPIRGRQLRGALAAWTADLPDSDEAKNVPPFVYEAFGAKFTIEAPFRKNRRGRPDDRAIGVRSLEPYWGTPGDGIRESVDKKASKYGELDAPYVLAVNATGEYQSEEDATDALLGSPCVTIRQFDDGRRETKESRNPDGVWWGQNGPRNTGLSAVLFTKRLSPWSVELRRALLIRSPWAARPLAAVPLQVDELNPVEGKFVKSEGISLGAVVGLHKGWPEEPVA